MKGKLSFVLAFSFCFISSSNAFSDSSNLPPFSTLQAITPHQQEITFCVNQEECASHCSCQFQDGQGICMDPNFEEKLSKCFCSSTSQCSTNDICLPFDETSSACANCVNAASIAAMKNCGKGDSRSLPEQKIPVTVLSDDLDEEPAPSYEAELDSNAPCISTSWLEDNDLISFTLRPGRKAHVLCIPGLPCGTKGHLLRECEQSKSCSLKTYNEICEKRTDCTESVMLVSQLSHTFDWSIVKSNDLELTSLSCHPDSVAYSTSRLVAYATDMLNKNNFGVFCNFVARLNYITSIGIRQYLNYNS